jgi:tetratricopeptide (TPR) repeat protein
VTGETGIGKTRLAEAFAADAEARGAAVRVGRCWETDGAPAFWPWIQILRDELRARGAEEMRERLGAAAPELLQLLPELGEQLHELPAAAPVEPRQARFRLFDAVTRLCKEVSRSAPLVLVLDDLHRADLPSLRLLEFIGRELAHVGIVLIGTYREDELAADRGRRRCLRELARAASAHYLPLEGLDREGIAELVERDTGCAPPDVLVAALHQQTGGNPFFLSQVLPTLTREAQSRGGLEQLGAEFAPLYGVRQAVVQRLEGLSDRARAILEAAAVLGQRFDTALLAKTQELSPAALRAGLTELTRAGITLEDPDTRGHFRFAHALVRDALYSELAPSSRARRHLRAGRALEQNGAARKPEQLAELAHHFYEARAAGGAKRSLDYSIAAARWAAKRLAFEDACRHYLRALELCERPESDDEAGRCDLLVELGQAQLGAGDNAASRSSLLRAAELARGLREPERLARAAIAMAQSFQPFELGIVDEHLVAVLEAALERLSERDSAMRARLLMALGVALYWADDRNERSTTLCEQALAVARRLGEPETLLATMSAVISVRWGPDLVEERAELADEAIRVGETAGVREELIDARLMRLVAWFELGRMDDVDRELAEIGRLAARLEHSEVDEFLPWFRATRAIMRGDFASAEPLAEEFLQDAARRDDERGPVVFALQLLGLRWVQGRSAEILELVEELCERHPAVSLYRAARLRSLCDLERRDEARRLLEALLPGDRPLVAKRLGWFPTLALMAESAALLGDRPRCAILYRELSPYAQRHVTSGSAAYLGSTSRYLGILAAELERFDMADRHFRTAAQMESRLGARPLLAWTAYHHAQMLYREGLDPARARACAERALKLADELGLERLAERARELG